MEPELLDQQNAARMALAAIAVAIFYDSVRTYRPRHRVRRLRAAGVAGFAQRRLDPLLTRWAASKSHIQGPARDQGQDLKPYKQDVAGSKPAPGMGRNRSGAGI
jgi:hypothetical protein